MSTPPAFATSPAATLDAAPVAPVPASSRSAHLEHALARRHWDARVAETLERARLWRNAALTLLGLCVVLAGTLAFEIARAPLIPVLVKVDALSRTEVVGRVAALSVTDDALKRAALARFIEDWRAVMADGVAQRAAIERVYAQIAAGSAAQEEVSEFYRKDPPGARGRTLTVGVQVASVYPATPRSFAVEWVETVRDLEGSTQRTERWQGTLTITQTAPQDEAQLRRNPLGLYVTDVAWSKVIS